MPIRPATIALIALLHGLVAVDRVEAQRQKFKIGGGAGFAFLSDPDLDLGSTAAVGGFFGLRFNDNLNLETAMFFVRSNRVFNANSVPVDQTPDRPAFRFETNRYQIDGTLTIFLGRRQPFHPFILAGGGLRRADDKQTDFTFETNPETGRDILVSEEVVLRETVYKPVGVFGVGAEIYFMYNLAARAEWRWWLTQDWDEKTHMLYFAASYFF